MTSSLRFHVLMLPNVPWAELRGRALRVEELGIEALGLADHFVDWTNPPVPWFETYTLLGALAEATSTVRLTTVVAQIPLRPPAMLARQILTLDHISGGRIEVGLGTGLTIDPSYAMAGLPNWSAGERVARFGEYVELVGLLLGQEITTYAGRFYDVDGAYMNPRPVQSPRPPIMVAALGERMIALAARHADMWNSISFKTTTDEQLAETATRNAFATEVCEEIGRDPSTLTRSYTLFDPQARPRGGALGYYDSVEAFRDHVGKVIDIGIRDVGIYYPILAEQSGVFEQCCAEVLPELRVRFAG